MVLLREVLGEPGRRRPELPQALGRVATAVGVTARRGGREEVIDGVGDRGIRRGPVGSGVFLPPPGPRLRLALHQRAGHAAALDGPVADRPTRARLAIPGRGGGRVGGGGPPGGRRGGGWPRG